MYNRKKGHPNFQDVPYFFAQKFVAKNFTNIVKID